MPATLDDAVPIFVRLPSPLMQRFRIAAAVRGQTLQTVMSTLIERFLDEDGKRPLEVAQTLMTLRASAAGLRTRWGLTELWAPQAVVRGEMPPGEAVVLECAFEPGARVSLVALSSLRAKLIDLLDAPVTLSVQANRPVEADHGAAERDMVRIFSACRIHLHS